MTDFEAEALAIPLDPDLLEPLGRVAWAAARLHSSIRDAINALDGAPSDAPFDDTLGGSRRQLADKARAIAMEPDRSQLITWCTTTGEEAVEARNGVLHAVTFTADDGQQALGGTTPARPRRYLRTELLRVAGQLSVASRLLPRGPYAK